MQRQTAVQEATIRIAFFHIRESFARSRYCNFTLHETNCLQPISTVGHAVAQLIEALRHKSEGRGFNFR